MFAAGGGLSAGGVFLGAPPEMGAGAAAITLVAVGGLQVTNHYFNNNMTMMSRVSVEREGGCCVGDGGDTLMHARRKRQIMYY